MWYFNIVQIIIITLRCIFTKGIICWQFLELMDVFKHVFSFNFELLIVYSKVAKIVFIKIKIKIFVLLKLSTCTMY